MYTAVRGIYEKGKLTFTERPPEVEKSEVVVLFMKPDVSGNHQKVDDGKKGVNLGSLADKGYSIPENFNDPLSDLEDYM
jgi:hypothetical protein